MCEALKELFADDLRESREQGIIEGRIEGRNACLLYTSRCV